MSSVRTFSALSAALLLAGLAQARPNTYTSAASGAWDDPASWTGNEPSGFPQATDTATIGNGHTISITVSGANNVEEVANLTISSGGFLEIEGSASYRAALEFPVVSGAGTPSLSIAGTDALKIKAYGDVKIFESMTLAEGGSSSSFRGYDNTAKIVMDGAAAAVTLTLGVRGHGAFEIQGTAGGSAENLTNNIMLEADAAGTLKLASSLGTVNDLSGLRWKANHASGILFFDTPQSGLNGNFQAAAGTLQFNQNVTTGGTFSISCPSSVDVNSATFDYSSVASENCTPDPDPSAISSDFNCACDT